MGCRLRRSSPDTRTSQPMAPAGGLAAAGPGARGCPSAASPAGGPVELGRPGPGEGRGGAGRGRLARGPALGPRERPGRLGCPWAPRPGQRLPRAVPGAGLLGFPNSRFHPPPASGDQPGAAVHPHPLLPPSSASLQPPYPAPSGSAGPGRPFQSWAN